MDSRSLHLFRICLGVYQLANLALRSFSLEAHYTDAGVLPRSVLLPLLEPSQISLHLMSGSLGFEVLLFAIQVIVIVLFTLGIKTRWTVTACWILEIFLQRRNPMVLDASDSILAIFLLWSTLLPLNNANLKEKVNQDICSWGTGGYILQLFLIYLFSSILKIQSGLWLDISSGGAVYYGLQDTFTSPLAEILVSWPRSITGGLSVGVVVFELLAPLIYLVARRPARLRTPLVVSFMMFHLGIGLLIGIWKFAALSMILWIPLIPESWWKSRSTASSHTRWLPSNLDGIMAVSLLFLAMMGNLYSIGIISHDWIVRINPLLSALDFNQNWSMYTIDALKNPVGIEIRATSTEGEEGVISIKGITQDPSLRWHNYLGGIAYGEKTLANQLARYLCRHAGEPKRITVLRFTKNDGHREELGKTECITIPATTSP
jgi:hypothetical protein